MGFKQGLCELYFFSSVPPQLVPYTLPGTAPGEPIKKVCCVGDSCTSGGPLPSKSLHSFTSLMRKYCRSIGQGRRINEQGSEPGFLSRERYTWKQEPLWLLTARGCRFSRNSVETIFIENSCTQQQ